MKKFSIGYRTLKTAVGAALAIALAHFFDLQFYTSAAILTILCIQPTKRKSVHAVYTRFVASLLGMLLAWLAFELISYHPIMLGIMFIIFLPLLVSFHVTAGFVSSAVIVLHIYSVGHFSWTLLQNEIYLMLIGYGVGLAVNMYMPDIQPKLDAYRLQIEAYYQKIFSEIAQYLRNGESLWDGHELIAAAEVINKAKAIAFQDVENHLTRKSNSYYVYFDMREQQLEIIERILPKITALPVIVQQAEVVAVFMEDLSEHVHSGNTASHFIEKLDQVKVKFAEMPLPTDHQTFLAMAALYQCIEEMEQYLAIKQSFAGLHK